MKFRTFFVPLVLWAGMALLLSGSAEESLFPHGGSSLYRVEEGTLTVAEGVTAMGLCEEYREEPDGSFTAVSHLLPEDVCLGTLDLTWEDLGISVRRAVFPKSLRILGGESMILGNLEELRLQGGPARFLPDAFYAMYIEKFTLAADYEGEVPLDSTLRIGAWNVEEGNSSYISRDGVLFTADGKTLVSYPNARPGEHYDVPAGTEIIGRRAFAGSDMDLSLKSVSLPVGLKRIEGYAFSGCGRLAALTVPLTVTELDPTAFHNCVSLERLSLPPGLTADLSSWARQPDFTWFNGDNGGTGSAPPPAEEWEEEWEESRSFVPFAAVLDNPSGTGAVPVYPDALSPDPSGEAPVGTAVWVQGMKNGRLEIRSGDMLVWVNPEELFLPQENLFFTVTGAEITCRDSCAPEGSVPEFLFVTKEGASFYVPETQLEFSVPFDGVRLSRENGSPEETLGLILGGSPSVQVLDAPAGAPLFHLYFDEQARVLETRNGWLRIESGRGEGWIPSDNLIPVWPKASADLNQ